MLESMKVLATKFNMTRNAHDFHDRHYVTVDVQFKMDDKHAQEAYALFQNNRGEVTILPGTAADKSREIKRNDEIRYKFIRKGGSEVETSMWMKVLAVNGEFIICKSPPIKGRTYEFNVMTCQVVEIRAKKFDTVDNLAEPTKDQDVVRFEHLEMLGTDPNASLRKKVLEFNLE